MATSLLVRMAQGSHDKTAHPAMQNAGNVVGSVASVRNAVSARNANGVNGLTGVEIVRNALEIVRNVAAANVVSSNLQCRRSLIC